MSLEVISHLIWSQIIPSVFVCTGIFTSTNAAPTRGLSGKISIAMYHFRIFQVRSFISHSFYVTIIRRGKCCERVGGVRISSFCEMPITRRMKDEMFGASNHFFADKFEIGYCPDVIAEIMGPSPRKVCNSQ